MDDARQILPYKASLPLTKEEPQAVRAGDSSTAFLFSVAIRAAGLELYKQQVYPKHL